MGLTGHAAAGYLSWTALGHLAGLGLMVARIVDSVSARVRVGRRNIPEDGGILEVVEGHAAYLAGRLTAKDFAAKLHEADVGDEGLEKRTLEKSRMANTFPCIFLILGEHERNGFSSHLPAGCIAGNRAPGRN